MAALYILPQDTASEASHSWVTAQLQQCLADHEECIVGHEVIPPLPTRVLDLGLLPAAADPIHVLETHGSRGQYIALSHCWGDPKLMPTKLTAHTLNKYQQGIPYNSLPRTFQDAVTFTRKMGIRYLWIDSLCIIQRDHDRDSEQDKELSDRDWASESGQMCNVYRNSHLTLAAASSTDCTGGLFFRLKVVELNGTTDDGPYQLFCREGPRHQSIDFPLMKRGWVAQEQLLSPRTLFFGEKELLWQCLKRKGCQCGHSWAEFPGHSKLPKTDHWSEERFREQTGLDIIRHFNFKQLALIKKWHETIASYSATSLSYPTDKLAAIDGIAQYMHPMRNCDYLAGLWSDSLPFDLLWSIVGAGSTRVVESSTNQRKLLWSSDQDLFPTWSWASVDCEVTWELAGNLECPEGGIMVTRVEDQVIPKAYELRLRGVLVPCWLGVVRATNQPLAEFPDIEPMLFRPDCIVVEELDDRTEVYCLRVLRYKGSTGFESENFCSLVLQIKDGERNAYERLGIVAFESGRRDGLETFHDIDDDQDSVVELGTYQNGAELFPPWWEPYEGWKVEEVILTLV